MQSWVRRYRCNYSGGSNLPGDVRRHIMCREDDLIDANRSFCDKLINAGADVAYTEEPGRHEWNFWDVHIRRVIEEWLPLERGNV